MITPLLKYRGLIWRNAVADLRHRYAGTGLGVVWNVLHPLALIAVFSLVFSVIMEPPAPPPGVSGRTWYVLYLCSGLLPWLAFSECVMRGASAFTDNASYLKKLAIPEQVFVAQAAVSATLGLAISFSLLLAIALALGVRPTPHWLLLPVPLVALQALGFALGLLSGTLNVFFRDLGQLLAVLLQVVMWTLPIVYLADRVPGPIQSLLAWHPVYPALEAIRDLFHVRRYPEPWLWPAMLAWPAAVLVLAGVVFNRLRPEIRDVL